MKTIDTSKLSRYQHFGSHEGGLLIDAIAWNASMDGPDDECGTVDSDGWYGLMTGPIVPADGDPDAVDLTATDLEALENYAGCIVRQDSAGFVDVEWHDTADELAVAWLAVESRIHADDEAPADGWDFVD